MTPRQYLSCLILSFFFSITANGANNYNFQFQIKGLNSSEKCILGYYLGEYTYSIDSASITKNGVIQFKGKRNLPTGMYFVMLPKVGIIDFIINDDYTFQAKTDVNNIKKNLTVSGSIENTAFFDYTSFVEKKKEEIEQQQAMLNMLKRATKDVEPIRAVEERIDSLRQAVAKHAYQLMNKHTTTFFCTMMEANELPVVPSNIATQINNQSNPIYVQYVKDHFWDNFDFTEVGLIRTKIFPTKANFFLEKLTTPSIEGVKESVDIIAQKSKVNPAILLNTLQWLITKFENPQLKGGDAIFVHVYDNYFESPEKSGIDVATFSRVEQKANYFRPTLMGNKAPEIKLLDQNEKPTSLHALEADFTMLYFFSPLCDKCRVATPTVVEIFKKYEAKGLKGFSVCTDDKKEYWKAYLKENKLPWTCVLDTDDDLSVEQQYSPNQLPNIYLLDKDKKILASRISVGDLEATLQVFIK